MNKLLSSVDTQTEDDEKEENRQQQIWYWKLNKELCFYLFDLRRRVHGLWVDIFYSYVCVCIWYKYVVCLAMCQPTQPSAHGAKCKYIQITTNEIYIHVHIFYMIEHYEKHPTKT